MDHVSEENMVAVSALPKLPDGGCACRHSRQLPSWESRDRNHVFLRDMIRRMAASFHMPFETLHQGKRSAWEESRYHPQFINLICYAPFRPAGGGIDTVIYASFGELGAHTGTPWGHRES